MLRPAAASHGGGSRRPIREEHSGYSAMRRDGEGLIARDRRRPLDAGRGYGAPRRTRLPVDPGEDIAVGRDPAGGAALISTSGAS